MTGTAPPARGKGKGAGFHPAFRGYRMDQVDEVVDRLETAVAEQAREIALLTGDHEPAVVPVVASPAAADAPDIVDDPGPGLPGWVVTGWRASAEPEVPAGPPPRARPRDLLALTAYLLFGVYVMQNLLRSHGTGYLSQGVQDQQAFEWYFAATAHNVAHLANPLFSNLENFPSGVNLMANAAVVGLGIPLTPLTLLSGAGTTFFMVEWLGMSLTAAGWYWLFIRRLRVNRAAAFVGGWLTGFAPAMVSHANGHPNFVAAFLVPVIIDRLIALRDGAPWVRNGIVLGLLVSWQVLIGEEVLLLASIGLGVLGLVLLAHRRLHLRRLLPGAALGVAVTALVAGFPLWWQFFGPQSYTSLWHPPAGNDLAALWGQATRSRGADPWVSAALSMNRTEENAFFGVLLWFVAVLVVVLLYRRPLVRGLAAVLAVATWLSLGDVVLLHGSPTGLPALWSLVQSLPVLENVLPTRFAIVAVPVFAALLALGVDAAGRVRLPRPYAASGVAPWLVSATATTVALLVAVLALRPVIPTPLVVDPRPAMPSFFTDGRWRSYFHGGSLLAAPPPDVADAWALDWQIAAGMGFPVAEGYFVGPSDLPDRSGQYGATRTALSLWLYDVNAANEPMFATKDQRDQFALDLRTERVDAIVLPERTQTQALLSSLEPLFGIPDHVGGVYVWDVRAFRERAG